VSTTTPYAALTPDVILDAIERLGYRADGRMLTLNSYENRVYHIGIDDAPPLIAKFYRPGRWTDAAIAEEHTFSQALADQEIPVIPPLASAGETLHHFEGFRFSVSPKVSGRAPEFDSADTLTWMGRFIGRIHLIGATQSFQHRHTLDIATFGVASRDFILQGDWVPPPLRPAYESVSALALEAAQHCFHRAGPYAPIRLHGDCHAGNVLWNNGPQFVDFDDCCTGPAIQDLWMLLSGPREDQQRQLRDVVAGYEDFAEFDDRQLPLIEALRTLRLLHYSAWIARRWDDPAFPAAFTWFGTERYWQDRILELREQVALMQEPPLVV
jgi:Ser/Thr protein kinase RdoA (MazF antagonist)